MVSLTRAFAKTKQRLFADQALPSLDHWGGIFSALMVLQMVWGPPAFAQAPRPLPTVTRVADMFETYPAAVRVENWIALKAKNSPSIRQLLKDGLQVRIFTLRRGESMPNSIVTIDNCDVFLTTVLPIGSPRDLEATIPPLGAGWLSLSDTEKTIESGRYYLVFEKSGPTSQQFRLRHTDFDAYFDSGFILMVENNERVSVKQVVDARYAQFDHNATLIRQINRGEKKEPCYAYTRLNAEAEPETQLALGQLDFCANIPPMAPEM